MNQIKYYYITENKELLYFDYMNVNYDIDAFANAENVPYFDGLEWTYNDRKYKLEIKETGVYAIWILQNKIFVQYNGKTAKFLAPDQLVIYKSVGEIEKIITTPTLPTGKKGGGVYGIGGKDDRHLRVTYWEHEDSWWVYDYILDIDTYEFVFEMRWRP